MEKLINYIKKMINEKFTGTIEVTFNQGGVRGAKKIIRENIEV